VALMRKRIAASYIRARGPMKIDCGYRPNGVVKMFHAVSLDGTWSGKVLAYPRPGCRRRAAVERRGWSDAVVEPCALSPRSATEADADTESAQRYRSAWTHEMQEIRVLTINDLAAAETARIELRCKKA